MGTRDVAAAYDTAADLYQGELASGSVSRTMLERFSPLFPGGAQVIDVGCGAGRASRWIADRGLSVLSIDISLEMLRRTRDGRPDSWTALADMRALPVADASFDGLTAFFSLVHIPKAEVSGVLREFHRVLRPRCAMLVSVRQGHTDGERVKEWTGGHVVHFSDFTEEELHGLLGDAGFRAMESESCPALMEGELTTHLFVIATTV